MGRLFGDSTAPPRTFSGFPLFTLRAERSQLFSFLRIDRNGCNGAGGPGEGEMSRSATDPLSNSLLLAVCSSLFVVSCLLSAVRHPLSVVRSPLFAVCCAVRYPLSTICCPSVHYPPRARLLPNMSSVHCPLSSVHRISMRCGKIASTNVGADGCKKLCFREAYRG